MQGADPIASALKTLDCDEEAKEVMQLNMRGMALDFVFLIFISWLFYFYLWCGLALVHTVVSEFWRGYESLCNLYTSLD